MYVLEMYKIWLYIVSFIPSDTPFDGILDDDDDDDDDSIFINCNDDLGIDLLNPITLCIIFLVLYNDKEVL